ncbi:MAG: ROK family protein [Sphaerochaeta sp.]|nr:ROK family protein [Sphaerochaeta sp.]
MTISYIPEYLKVKNRKLIFDLFLEHEKLARSELVSLTNMSFPTVSKSVDYLLSRNILMEEGIDSNMSGPGRKRKKLVFNSSAFSALAINLEGQIVEIGIIDLSGNILSYNKHEFKDFLDPRSQIALGKEIQQTLKRAPSPVLGIGIGFPSNINPVSEEIVSFYSLGISHPVPISKVFSPLFSQFEAQVFIENDVNLAAKGEVFSRRLEEKRCNLCYLTLGSGFGSGIMLNGELWAGVGFKAGEIGNMLIEPIDLGKPLSGQTIPLEQRVNIQAINRHFSIDLLQEGELDPVRKSLVIDFLIPVLSTAVFNVAYFLDIEDFILAGVIPGILGNGLLEKIEATVNAMLENRGRKIRVSPPFSSFTTLIGAASLVFDKTILDGLNG